MRSATALRRHLAVGTGLVIALCAWLSVAAHPAHAHTRSLSYSSWRMDDGGARVRVRIPRLELTRLGLDLPPGDEEAARVVGSYLAGRLDLYDAVGRCGVPEAPSPRSAQEGWAHLGWSLTCAGGPPTRIATRILLDVAPSHLHFARIALPDGRIVERLLTEADPGWELATLARGGPDASEDDPGGLAAVGSGVGSYVALGVEHILSGWDHLAFVLALLLLASSLGEVARVVTGFTIAHSVTLAMAVLGWVHPHAPAVEAVIGFSVALVAAENTWMASGRRRAIPLVAVLGLLAVVGMALGGVGALSVASACGLALFTASHFGLLARSQRPARIRAALAFAFGLVHGFGFAGVLGEMQLPTERLAPALFGFNVGVELGQLAVVGVAWPALRLLARPAGGRWYRLAIDVGSACICGIGLYWFATRAFASG